MLININLKKIDIYENWIIKYREIVQNTYVSLKLIDDKQMFEKDDEVGFVFENIMGLIQDLHVKTYDIDENQEKIKTSNSVEDQDKIQIVQE